MFKMEVGLDLKKLEKYSDWSYILFLIIPLVILYFRVLIGKTFFWDDALFLWYPYRHFAANCLRDGIFPLWNPYLLGGTPFQADIQSALIYPFNLAMTPFVYNGWLSTRAVQVVTILHVYLGGIFMFFLMKKLLGHKFSALFSSLVYMMLPQIVYRSVQPLVLESMIWLPLLFLVAVHLVEKRKWIFSVLGGIIVALNLFTGFPHFALMNFSFVSVYIFTFLIKDFFIKKKFKSGSHLILMIITMFIIGAGLFAVQLLPTMEFTEITTREVGWNYELATDFSFHPIRLIGILIPEFFGDVSPLNYSFWLRDFYYSVWEMAIYFGMLPLAFAVYALLRKKSFKIKFFAVAALLSLWFALGRYGFAYYLIYLTPAFHKFRCPSRFAYLFDFSMIILAGYGIKDILTRPVDKKLIKNITIAFLVIAFFIIIFITGIFKGEFYDPSGFEVARTYSIVGLVIILITALIMFKLENFKKFKYMSVFLFLFVFSDLFLVSFGVFEDYIEPKEFFTKTEEIKFFEKNSSEYCRVDARIDGLELFFPRNVGCVHRFYTLQGYVPLRLLDYTRMKNFLREDIRLDLYNVKYDLNTEYGYQDLFERSGYLPRAKIYYNYLVEKDKEKVLGILNSGELDYENIIILDKVPSMFNLKYYEEGLVNIKEYSENSIYLETFSRQEGILFLSEHFYPGWKAYVDNKEKRVLKAFGAFRAVVIPAGFHKVKFVFRPDSFVKGKNISIVTLIFTIIIFVLSLMNYRKKIQSLSS